MARRLKADLETARAAWVKAAKTPKQAAEREKSDFLSYQNRAGLVADRAEALNVLADLTGEDSSNSPSSTNDVGDSTA